MNPMRLLFLLTVTGTTGSILFAGDPVRNTAQNGTATGARVTAAAQQPAAADDEAAAEKVAPEQDEADEKENSAKAPGEEQTAAAAKDEDVDPAPPAKTDADRGSSPQRFVPSEQVRADFDVSFPIDI